MTLSQSLPQVEPLPVLAEQVFAELRNQKLRIVFAESCTGGLLASTMATLPGVSEVLCGSAVSYRNETKACWLEVSRDDLNNPNIGPVSKLVAYQMVQGALVKTPEADLAAAITGHLGPNAPHDQDGVIDIGIWKRGEPEPTILEYVLPDAVPPEGSLREFRRHQAASLVLQAVLRKLTQSK